MTYLRILISSNKQSATHQNSLVSFKNKPFGKMKDALEWPSPSSLYVIIPFDYQLLLEQKMPGTWISSHLYFRYTSKYEAIRHESFHVL